MRMSPTFKEIFGAIVEAQALIGSAQKNKVNPHLKNKYADFESVWAAVSPALQSCKLALIQTPQQSDDGKLHLETMIIHASGEFIAETMVMPLQKQDPQGYGSALTYSRRYHVSAMLGVVQDDDDAHSAVKSNASAIKDAISECADADALQAAFNGYYAQYKTDPAMLRVITAAKDKRKAELNPAPFNPAKVAKKEPAAKPEQAIEAAPEQPIDNF